MGTVTTHYRFVHTSWRILSIGQLLLVGYLLIYLSTAKGTGPSWQLLLLAMGTVVAALMVIFFTLWMNPARLKMLQRRVNRRVISRWLSRSTLKEQVTNLRNRLDRRSYMYVVRGYNPTHGGVADVKEKGE